MIVATVFSLFHFLRTQGTLGPLYYGLFLAAWTVICLPTTPLEVAAGFTFSPTLAVSASVVGKTMGSIIAFTLGRTLMARYLASRARSEESTSGFLRRARLLSLQLESELLARPLQTITMVRASPMPIAIKNYALAMLPPHVVPWRTFAITTLVVNIPYSIAWSLTGSSASSLQEALSGQGEVDGRTIVAKIGTLVVLFSGLYFFARRCRAGLAAAELRDEKNGAQPLRPRDVSLATRKAQ